MKPRFLFVNTRPAQCSIFKSGEQFYNAIDNSEHWDLDYVEISDLDKQRLHSGEIVLDGELQDPYDVYIFNYHDITMRSVESIDSKFFVNLPGQKFTIVLEVEKDNPTPRVFSDDFDGYIVLDPTLKFSDPRFYAFPRPVQSQNLEYLPGTRPVIGSFGLPTQDKYFDRIVNAVNKEFDNAVVRINIPKATYADPDDTAFNSIANKCKSLAKPGIEVQITREFFTDEDLIKWCSQNTLNVFLYDRNMPGLSAVTDQAIASGRPLAVSTNITFRHVHEYIKPYPERTLKQSIELSGAEVKQMQQAWSPESCKQRLTAILFE
jgi:hypothetical protein